MVTSKKVEDRGSRFSKGIYLLPNAFTTAALFAGFYAVVAAMKGMYSVAAVAIFIAMLADALDGRVARLTNTQSAFGAEYDSLSDMVAFGVAPALVCYSWSLHSLGKIGWLAAFFYVAATGLRLARFNVQVDTPDADKRYFSGLPCPSAAGLLAGITWVHQLYPLQNYFLDIVIGMIVVGVGILMVSNVRYRSFKDIDLKKSAPFIYVFVIVLFIVFIALDPPQVLFGLFCLYVISGPVLAIKRKLQKQ